MPSGESCGGLPEEPSEKRDQNIPWIKWPVQTQKGGWTRLLLDLLSAPKWKITTYSLFTKSLALHNNDPHRSGKKLQSFGHGPVSSVCLLRQFSRQTWSFKRTNNITSLNVSTCIEVTYTEMKRVFSMTFYLII